MSPCVSSASPLKPFQAQREVSEKQAIEGSYTIIKRGQQLLRAFHIFRFWRCRLQTRYQVGLREFGFAGALFVSFSYYDALGQRVLMFVMQSK